VSTAASVHRRLLNHARQSGQVFNQVLQMYVLQRFLHRLGKSAESERYILKGALMLAVWQSPESRPTRDIDLLGTLDNAIEVITDSMRRICATNGGGDGLRFPPDGISAERTMEGAAYAGVRVRMTAYLGKARVPFQVDIGFGDAVVPGPSDVSIPCVLDLAPACLRGYSRESCIAEKLQTMVALGEINSRMKDFYDIWLLATTQPFTGSDLAAAITATFRRRKTEMVWPIAALDSAFATPERETQWRAFIRRSRLGEPETLRETLVLLAGFVEPVVNSLELGTAPAGLWPPGGPWGCGR